MATAQGSLPSISALRSCRLPSSSKSWPVSVVKLPEIRRRRSQCSSACRRLNCRAMVQQDAPGAPATYAKDMERVSAKAALLLALKDYGGFKAFVSGKLTDVQQLDITEKIIGVERLNPTPRPTTSPILEGRWNFELFGSGTPAVSAAKQVFERFASTLANLSKMELEVKDGKAMITLNIKLLSLIESKVIVTTKLSVEGPLRMKEDSLDGVFELPKVAEETLPEQLKGALNQAASTAQQLPVPFKDAVSNGLKFPLTGTFQRLFMISYLDEEILIIRGSDGLPEVLTRIDVPLSPAAAPATDYES